MTIPNFFILGTQKAATTSIYFYLKQHPEIYMSRIKEPGFFIEQGLSENNDQKSDTISDLSEYEALFAEITNESRYGEATPTYLACPWVPKYIHTYSPDAKLIAVLRNPIDRAWSHYQMHASLEHPMFSENFLEAIDEQHVYLGEEEDWIFSFVTMGMYYTQINNYLKYFNSDQLHIVLYEDLRQDIEGQVKGMFEFLDVDPDFLPNFNIKANVSGVPRNKQLQRFIMRKNPLKTMLKRFLSPEARLALTARAKSLNSSGKMSIPKEAVEELTYRFEADIDALELLLQRDLSVWRNKRYENQ